MTDFSRQILTFYSYKGGVGRSMGLANVATLLAKWRRRVLVVDWDLEAPGIEAYFKELVDLSEQRERTPGVIDLVCAIAAGEELDWHNCLLSVPSFDKYGEELKVISAGKNDGNYRSRVQTTNWEELFKSKELGMHLETLRNAWKQEFDYILVDSRTGITDIGGVCTIHLPDSLVIWFTTNKTSVSGVKDVAEQARMAHISLPFERNPLLILPVPSRDESQTELEKANEWKKIFANEFDEFFKQWLPNSVASLEAVDKIRIPYIPYWSFEEGLPVAVKDTSGLGRAYDTLSRLIFFQLQWLKIDENPEQSIEYLNRVVDLDPERFGPDYADTLSTHALNLWKEGLTEKSIDPIRRAIKTWEHLIEDNLSMFGLKLAKAKSFLSDRLYEEADIPGSTSEANKAVDIYFNLAESDPNRFGDEAASGLTELYHRLSINGDAEGALNALRKATHTRISFAPSKPIQVEPDLAEGLYEISNLLIESERFSEALEIIREVNAIYSRLIKSDKERFGPELAHSYITLSECLLETGNAQEALEAGQKAVEIFQHLAWEKPRHYDSDLAKSFEALLDILSQLDVSGIPEALSSIRDAVAFFRQLAKDQKQYEPALAKSLNMLPEPLKSQGHLEEALETQQEVVKIFRLLALTQRAQYEPDLASSLVYLSRLLCDKGNVSKAREAVQEAIKILRRLLEISPARSQYKEDYEEALKLADRLDS